MARPRNPFGDPVSIRRRGGLFTVRYYPTGLITDPRSRRDLPQSFRTLAEAEAAAALLREKLVEHRRRYANAPSRLNAGSLAAALDAYVAELARAVARGDLPEGTRRKRASDLNLYVRPTATATPLPIRDLPGAIARDLVDAIPEAKKADGSLKATNTVGKAPGSLREFGKWLVAEGYLAEDPFAFVDEDRAEHQEAKKRASRRRAVSRVTSAAFEGDGDEDRGIGLEEVPPLAVVSALSDAIFRRETGLGRANQGGAKPLSVDVARQTAAQPLFQTATGLRLCETLAVHTSRIDLDALTVGVDRQLDRYKPWVPGQDPPLSPPKHDRSRLASIWPVYAEPLAELMAYADAHTGGWLFAPTRGQRWWADGRKSEWLRAIELLAAERRSAVEQGVPEDELSPLWTWRPHATRHAYGSYSLAPVESGGLGWSVAMVSRSMGHKDESTTMDIYRHVTSSERVRVRTNLIQWPGLRSDGSVASPASASTVKGVR